MNVMKNPKTTWAAILLAFSSIISEVVVPLLNETSPTESQLATAGTLLIAAVGLFFAKDSTSIK